MKRFRTRSIFKGKWPPYFFLCTWHLSNKGLRGYRASLKTAWADPRGRKWPPYCFSGWSYLALCPKKETKNGSFFFSFFFDKQNGSYLASNACGFHLRILYVACLCVVAAISHIGYPLPKKEKQKKEKGNSHQSCVATMSCTWSLARGLLGSGLKPQLLRIQSPTVPVMRLIGDKSRTGWAKYKVIVGPVLYIAC